MKNWEYAYNGYYFDVLQKDKIGSSVSIFHNDGKPDDPRPFSKEEAERLAKIIVDALNGAEKTAKEIKEADNQFQAQQDSGGTL